MVVKPRILICGGWKISDRHICGEIHERIGENGMDENVGCFTEEELLILSEGILSLIQNADNGLALIKNQAVHEIMANELQRYTDLNAKVCMMMGQL